MSMYDEDALKLFSHRPDIKAKHSHMSVKPKAKRKEFDPEAFLVFLASIIMLVTYACEFFF